MKLQSFKEEDKAMVQVNASCGICNTSALRNFQKNKKINLQDISLLLGKPSVKKKLLPFEHRPKGGIGGGPNPKVLR